jgi:hypothetical protein
MPYKGPLTYAQKLKRCVRNRRWRANNLEKARAYSRAWKARQAGDYA